MNTPEVVAFRRRLSLPEIIIAPLRMTLDESTVDRVSDLAVRVNAILADFTADEIRAFLRAHEAANTPYETGVE